MKRLIIASLFISADLFALDINALKQMIPSKLKVRKQDYICKPHCEALLINNLNIANPFSFQKEGVDLGVTNIDINVFYMNYAFCYRRGRGEIAKSNKEIINELVN